MKYMIMMFGSAEEMTQVQDEAWIGEMIGEMIQIDVDLRDSGELVFQAGLADGSTARLVRNNPGGTPIVTDGPFSEAKESLIGFWILDVASDERLVEICARIVKYSQVVEVRPLGVEPQVGEP